MVELVGWAQLCRQQAGQTSAAPACGNGYPSVPCPDGSTYVEQSTAACEPSLPQVASHTISCLADQGAELQRGPGGQVAQQ